MPITQETANLIDTLANAAGKIGSTAASAKINQVIVDLMPSTAAEELASLQISARIQLENLELLRGKLAQITQIATQSVAESASAVTEELVNSLADDFRQIITLAEPNDDEPAA